MPDMRVTPNQFSYNAAISACEKGGQWQLALSLLNTMADMRVIQDVISYSAVISACEKGGQWELALSLLRSMSSTGRVQNVISYSSLDLIKVIYIFYCCRCCCYLLYLFFILFVDTLSNCQVLQSALVRKEGSGNWLSASCTVCLTRG
jgi:pentatricopeptide repeat protein